MTISMGSSPLGLSRPPYHSVQQPLYKDSSPLFLAILIFYLSFILIYFSIIYLDRPLFDCPLLDGSVIQWPSTLGVSSPSLPASNQRGISLRKYKK